MRNGVQLGHATRYFVAYPILSWTILSIPMVTTRYTMGQFREGRAQLYVHRGMGTVGAVPLRLGSRPELALLTLRGS